MKTLKLNQQSFWYAMYTNETKPIQDKDGNFTGEYVPVYSKPKIGMGNISDGKGNITINPFGINEDYDRVIIPDNKASEIDEYSILWLDCVPVIDTKGNVITSHNYIVTKVANSLNSKTIAVKKVEVND